MHKKCNISQKQNLFFLKNMHIKDFQHEYLNIIKFKKTHEKSGEIICIHL